jgi:zinc transporter
MSIITDLAPSGETRGLGVVPGLIWAFRIHADGSAQALPIDKPIESRRDGWLWLHVNLADARTAEWLRGAALPAAALAMMLSRDRHQQLHATQSSVYGVFADVVQQIERPGDEIAHLRFVMTERLLVSTRHHALSSVEGARDTIEQGGRRLPHVAALLELIVEHVANGIDELVDRLATELDQIEEAVATGRCQSERPKLTRVRQTGVKLHRQLSGLRTLFHRLEREGTEGLPPSLQLAAGKLAQHLDALDHDMVEMRHRAYLLQEEIVSVIAEETNRNLHVLAVLTALFLPPTLITGIFGMNTKGLPFTEWETAFLWACALMVGSVIAVFLILRRVGIFRRPS